MKIDIKAKFARLRKEVEINKERINEHDQKILYLLLCDNFFETLIHDIHYRQEEITEKKQIAKKDYPILTKIRKLVLNIFRTHKLSQRWIITVINLILFQKIITPEDTVTIKEDGDLRVSITISEDISLTSFRKYINEKWDSEIKPKIKKLPTTFSTKKELHEIITGKKLSDDMRMGLKGKNLIPDRYRGELSTYYKKRISYKKSVKQLGGITDEELSLLLQERIEKELKK